MNSPDIEQIKKSVAELDAAAPRAGARVQLSQYGGGPDECKMVANQRGYLRLGIELLRAALAPPSPQTQERIQVDLRYLLTDDSTVRFDWFERREELAADTRAERKSSRLVPVILVLGLVAILTLAMIGLGTVIVWMTRVKEDAHQSPRVAAAAPRLCENQWLVGRRSGRTLS